MVKKANTLESLADLNLSVTVRSYLSRKYSNIDEIVWLGRYLDHVNREYPEAKEKSRDSTLELIFRLDRAGFIRCDINSGSFSIGRLYRAVYHDAIDITVLPSCLYDLCETGEKASGGETVSCIDYRLGNERYEEFQNPTDEQIDAVKMAMRSCLTDEEYSIVACQYGFEDRKKHSVEYTGKLYRVTRERVRQIEYRALNKLYCENVLPLL